MSAAVRCDGCGETAQRPALKHKLQSRVKVGDSYTLKHRDFCSDECLDDWAAAAIADREAAQARINGLTPSPAVMPSRVPA